MKPLNYAILKYVASVEASSVIEVMEALKEEYGHFKAFNRKDIVNALMTAEANGLIEEKSFELDANNELNVYYHAHDEGKATINRYIPN